VPLNEVPIIEKWSSVSINTFHQLLAILADTVLCVKKTPPPPHLGGTSHVSDVFFFTYVFSSSSSSSSSSIPGINLCLGVWYTISLDVVGFYEGVPLRLVLGVFDT